MALEIERKWLYAGEPLTGFPSIPASATAAEEIQQIFQGYALDSNDGVLRVRAAHTSPVGQLSRNEGWVTVKSAKSAGVNLEYEMSIPFAIATGLIDVCPRKLHKTRAKVPLGNSLVAEIDVFHGLLYPLVLIEVELPSIDFEFEVPSWFGKEVTGDHRYSNSNLVNLDTLDGVMALMT